MKILIPQNDVVWVRDSVVSDLWVAALGLDGLESSQEYPLMSNCKFCNFLTLQLEISTPLIFAGGF